MQRSQWLNKPGRQKRQRTFSIFWQVLILIIGLLFYETGMFSPPGATAGMHIYRIRRQLFKGARHVLGGLAIQEAWKIVVLNWIAWKWSWRFLVWKTYASSAEPEPKLWSVLGRISSRIQTSSLTLRVFSFGGEDEKKNGRGQGIHKCTMSTHVVVWFCLCARLVIFFRREF